LLINYGKYFDAYYLAEQAEEYISGDSILTELFARCSFNVDIETEPSGAHIFVKEYKNPANDWKHLGVTPILSIRLPNGILRMKTEKEGYETLIFATTTWDLDLEEQIDIPIKIQRILDKKGSISQGMVRVSGLETSKGKIVDFYIDKFEVTNNQFKKFIDDGGYRNKKFWKYEFIKDGRILAWEKAMSEFVDQTGRTGPSTWSAGYFPEGNGDHPVSGISWYEAAAYAEYVGKHLPTAYHWGVATGEGTPLEYAGFSNFVPFYNFNNKGTVPVGSLDGISSFGAYDMGGNVREWCWNETDLGRVLRGGAWNDPPYMFGNYSQALAFDRSEKNGFRLVIYPEKDKLPDKLFAKLSFTEIKDFSKINPVPDAIFQIYKEQFSYDKTALNPSIERRDENFEEWIQEKVSYNSPYESEKMIAYLFLPRNVNPPFQIVVYFPTSYAVYNKSSEVLTSEPDFIKFVDFIVNNGRAVLFPIYKGTYERIDPALRSIHIGQDSYAFSKYLIELVKEFRRSVDYIETREDIDKNKIAYYGSSWGGWLGSIIPAVEDRLKVNIMLAGGFIGNGRAEVNEINYVTRVKIPTLMLNGKYDLGAPIETNVRPMFEYLGTSQKKLEIYDSDHMPPRNEYVKEILNWLDLYLGPVR
jgi:eukaryotic-like serine/threonine-protein kinase